MANKPVSFRLYSSLTRVDDPVGRLLETPEAADLHLHAPLNAVIRFGKAGERLVPVKLRAHLTEVGTLEVWADSKISEHHWRLQFELRKTAGARTSGKPAAVVSDEALTQAEALLEAAFRAGTLTPEELPGKLEQALALGRNSWPLSAIRKLGDRLLELAETRRKSPALEMRWLNLTGFCCVPASDFRATISASSRRAASTRAGFNSPIRCRTRSIGGFFGAASRAGSTRISRWTFSSGFRRCCCRAEGNGRASTTVCCAKCGAPAQAWSCCRCKPKRSSATRCSRR